MKLLILGGTTEASSLARRLAGDKRFDAMLSLAGRTRTPAVPPIPFRVGGFGGAAGLARFLTNERIAALIDATHPFATDISGNAVLAARQADTARLAVVRPVWQRQVDDDWIEVASLRDAAAALGERERRVFLTIGRQELAAFANTPHRYLARSVDAPPEDRLPGAQFIAARGPFTLDAEIALLQTHRIECLVTKNSGGVGEAKLQAARLCGVQVVMVARPQPAEAGAVPDADAAYRWLERFHASRRGV